ncbi:hypothetical protein HLY09_18000 [Enterocloster bolteae]|jgi:hypothetical protein|uniref:hypothetical protein n=1 Tax=Enterocloster bolteae TaxID=208479 RepID=UPI000E41A436|nr:hypothetical protein [Enterocloster bolteae]QJU21152.1 hypothetical protein HLY09_18000 [Enterocloster bolteae]RGB80475.1 hypothetical protein DW097_27970 [Enterocloster clostridioformis]
MAAPEGYTKLGNVGYADKGVYSADATYNKYNTVYHEGSTYVALKDNLHGVTPADGANWRYMAKGFTEASADAITVIDTSGIIDGTKNKKTILQTFLDKVGDFIINKAVTNDALMLKLADYVAKTDIVQVESTATNKVPSSAYLKQVKDSIDSNLAKTNAKVTLNGVKNINGFTAVYSDRTDRAFQLYYDNGEIASIAFNNTGIWYDFYDGRNWKQVWKFNKPS